MLNVDERSYTAFEEQVGGKNRLCNEKHPLKALIAFNGVFAELGVGSDINLTHNKLYASRNKLFILIQLFIDGIVTDDKYAQPANVDCIVVHEFNDVGNETLVSSLQLENVPCIFVIPIAFVGIDKLRKLTHAANDCVIVCKLDADDGIITLAKLVHAKNIWFMLVQLTVDGNLAYSNITKDAVAPVPWPEEKNCSGFAVWILLP